jgi:hypothetical protein
MASEQPQQIGFLNSIKQFELNNLLSIDSSDPEYQQRQQRVSELTDAESKTGERRSAQRSNKYLLDRVAEYANRQKRIDSIKEGRARERALHAQERTERAINYHIEKIKPIGLSPWILEKSYVHAIGNWLNDPENAQLNSRISDDSAAEAQAKYINTRPELVAIAGGDDPTLTDVAAMVYQHDAQLKQHAEQISKHKEELSSVKERLDNLDPNNGTSDQAPDEEPQSVTSAPSESEGPQHAPLPLPAPSQPNEESPAEAETESQSGGVTAKLGEIRDQAGAKVTDLKEAVSSAGETVKSKVSDVIVPIQQKVEQTVKKDDPPSEPEISEAPPAAPPQATPIGPTTVSQETLTSSQNESDDGIEVVPEWEEEVPDSPILVPTNSGARPAPSQNGSDKPKDNGIEVESEWDDDELDTPDGWGQKPPPQPQQQSPQPQAQPQSQPQGTTPQPQAEFIGPTTVNQTAASVEQTPPNPRPAALPPPSNNPAPPTAPGNPQLAPGVRPDPHAEASGPSYELTNRLKEQAKLEYFDAKKSRILLEEKLAKHNGNFFKKALLFIRGPRSQEQEEVEILKKRLEEFKVREKEMQKKYDDVTRFVSRNRLHQSLEANFENWRYDRSSSLRSRLADLIVGERVARDVDWTEEEVKFLAETAKDERCWLPLDYKKRALIGAGIQVAAIASVWADPGLTPVGYGLRMIPSTMGYETMLHRRWGNYDSTIDPEKVAKMDADQAANYAANIYVDRVRRRAPEVNDAEKLAVSQFYKKQVEYELLIRGINSDSTEFEMNQALDEILESKKLNYLAEKRVDALQNRRKEQAKRWAIAAGLAAATLGLSYVIFHPGDVQHAFQNIGSHPEPVTPLAITSMEPPSAPVAIATAPPPVPPVAVVTSHSAYLDGNVMHPWNQPDVAINLDPDHLPANHMATVHTLQGDKVVDLVNDPAGAIKDQFGTRPEIFDKPYEHGIKAYVDGYTHGHLGNFLQNNGEANSLTFNPFNGDQLQQYQTQFEANHDINVDRYSGYRWMMETLNPDTIVDPDNLKGAMMPILEPNGVLLRDAVGNVIGHNGDFQQYMMPGSTIAAENHVFASIN